MRFSFLIIDDNAANVKRTLELFENFPICAGVVKDSQSAINQIIKVKPILGFSKKNGDSIERCRNKNID